MTSFPPIPNNKLIRHRFLDDVRRYMRITACILYSDFNNSDTIFLLLRCRYNIL